MKIMIRDSAITYRVSAEEATMLHQSQAIAVQVWLTGNAPMKFSLCSAKISTPLYLAINEEGWFMTINDATLAQALERKIDREGITHEQVQALGDAEDRNRVPPLKIGFQIDVKSIRKK
jgi:hypothetical protein